MNSHPCDRCNGDEQRWYLPLTNESVCHRCYYSLLSVLSSAEWHELRREPRNFIERDEKRQLWKRLNQVVLRP